MSITALQEIRIDKRIIEWLNEMLEINGLSSLKVNVDNDVIKIKTALDVIRELKGRMKERDKLPTKQELNKLNELLNKKDTILG